MWNFLILIGFIRFSIGEGWRRVGMDGNGRAGKIHMSEFHPQSRESVTLVKMQEWVRTELFVVSIVVVSDCYFHKMMGFEWQDTQKETHVENQLAETSPILGCRRRFVLYVFGRVGSRIDSKPTNYILAQQEQSGQWQSARVGIWIPCQIPITDHRADPGTP